MAEDVCEGAPINHQESIVSELPVRPGLVMGEAYAE
jgi:hypothetical protein